jgi:hypothetical protein
MILSFEPEDARYEHPSKDTPLDSPTSPVSWMDPSFAISGFTHISIGISVAPRPTT